MIALITINLLKEPTYESRSWIIKEALVAAFVFGLVGLGVWLNAQEKEKEIRMGADQIVTLEQQKGDFERQKKRLQERRQELSAIESKIESVRQLYGGRGDMLQILEQLQVNTPKGIWYSSISLRNAYLDLNATGSSPSAIAELISNFKNTAVRNGAYLNGSVAFSDVDLKKVTSTKRDEHAFVMTMRANVR